MQAHIKINFLLVSLFLLLGGKGTANIVSETALSDYDKADSIIIVKPSYFSDHPSGNQDIISVVKGPPLTAIPP